MPFDGAAITMLLAIREINPCVMLRGWWRRALVFATGLFVIVGGSLNQLGLPVAYAQAPDASVSDLERSLANGYMYLASRSRWPTDSNKGDRFVFCISQNHSLFDIFSRTLPLRKVNGMAVDIRVLNSRKSSSSSECHMVVFSRSDSLTTEWFAEIANLPILTISHEVDLTESGAIVYLAHDDKLRPPRINYLGMKKSGVIIDATILDLARRRWGMKME